MPVGVVIEPALTRFTNHVAIEGEIRNLILSVNSASTFGNSSTGSFNASRVTNVTILHFDLNDDLSTFPDIVFVFSFLGCRATHDLDTRLNDAFGTVGHIALTGMYP